MSIHRQYYCYDRSLQDTDSRYNLFSFAAFLEEIGMTEGFSPPPQGCGRGALIIGVSIDISFTGKEVAKTIQLHVTSRMILDGGIGGPLIRRWNARITFSVLQMFSENTVICVSPRKCMALEAGVE